MVRDEQIRLMRRKRMEGRTQEAAAALEVPPPGQRIGLEATREQVDLPGPVTDQPWNSAPSTPSRSSSSRILRTLASSPPQLSTPRESCEAGSENPARATTCRCTRGPCEPTARRE